MTRMQERKDTKGFDAKELSEEGPDVVEGMEYLAAYIANLLSTEPSYVKVRMVVAAWAQQWLYIPQLALCMENSAMATYIQLI